MHRVCQSVGAIDTYSQSHYVSDRVTIIIMWNLDDRHIETIIPNTHKIIQSLHDCIAKINMASEDKSAARFLCNRSLLLLLLNINSHFSSERENRSCIGGTDRCLIFIYLFFLHRPLVVIILMDIPIPNT